MKGKREEWSGETGNERCERGYVEEGVANLESPKTQVEVAV